MWQPEKFPSAYEALSQYMKKKYCMWLIDSKTIIPERSRLRFENYHSEYCALKDFNAEWPIIFGILQLGFFESKGYRVRQTKDGWWTVERWITKSHLNNVGIWRCQWDYIDTPEEACMYVMEQIEEGK